MKRTNALPVWLLAAAIPVAAWLAFTPSPARAQSTSGNQPFVGVWKLNVGKSHARVPPGFALYRQFRDDGDGWMFHTVITITPRGTYFLFAAARYDGKPYPDYTANSLGNLVRHATKPPRTVSFTRINAHRIRWTDRVNGHVVAGGTESVSPDGKTLTITDHVPGRTARHAQVFDRVSGPGALALAPNSTPPARPAMPLQEPSPAQKPVAFSPADFDTYVGYYQVGPTLIFHVYRHGNHYLTQLMGAGQRPLEWLPKSATEFASAVMTARIDFVISPGRQVTAMIFHQDGYSTLERRVSPAFAQRDEARLQQRIRQNTPGPGTEAAVRRLFVALETTGQAPYSEMAAPLARLARRQSAAAAAMITNPGALRSITFIRVLPTGTDDYHVRFAVGELDVTIAPLSPDGKVTQLRFRRLHRSWRTVRQSTPGCGYCSGRSGERSATKARIALRA